MKYILGLIIWILLLLFIIKLLILGEKDLEVQKNRDEFIKERYNSVKMKS